MSAAYPGFISLYERIAHNNAVMRGIESKSEEGIASDDAPPRLCVA